MQTPKKGTKNALKIMHASSASTEKEKLLFAETCRFAAELNSLRGQGDTGPRHYN